MDTLHRLALPLVTGVFLAGLATPVSAAPIRDLDCEDFPTQQDAQKEFNKHPTDIYHLDLDGDGIACECNPTVAGDPNSIPAWCQIFSAPRRLA